MDYNKEMLNGLSNVLDTLKTKVENGVKNGDNIQFEYKEMEDDKLKLTVKNGDKTLFEVIKHF